MLKLVGTDKGNVVSERVLIDEDGKLTKFGAALCVLDVAVDLTIFYLLHKGVKKIQGK